MHDIPFFPFRKIFSTNPVAAMHIRWICRRLKISHIHTHDSHALTFAVMAATFFGNQVPIIVHRRVDFPIGSHFLSNWKYNHKAIQNIICVSDFVREVLGHGLKNREKCVTIHDGIDLNSIVPHANTQADRPSYLIGNIAAIAPHKDYFTFVRTAEKLLSDGFSAKFQIIGGDGGEEVAIRNLIAEKELSDNFELLGFRDDVLDLLSRLDVLLFTSKTEGLGSTLLDAMAAGVPIVATEAGGIPEIVEHEKTGLLAPVGDAEGLAEQIKRMLSNVDLRENILANAAEKVRAYSKEKMAEQILEIYKS